MHHGRDRILAAAAVLTCLATAEPAHAASAGAGLSGTMGVGWDSDYSLLGSARPVPPPKNRALHIEDEGLASMIASAYGWLAPVPELELGLGQKIEFMQFFDAENLVVPRTGLWVQLRLAELLSLRIAGSYRYYRHSVFLEDVFHEPGLSLRLALHPGAHEVGLTYELMHRLLVNDADGTETEQTLSLYWRGTFLDDVLEVGARASGVHIRGTETWMQLDAVEGRLHVAFDWKMLDGGVAWSPAGVWFEDGIGFTNGLGAWFGVTWPDWLRTGVEYDYEKLDEARALPEGTEYDRHVVMLTLTFSWEWESSPPVAPQAGPQEGEPGIRVHGHEVTFVVSAPDASTVTLAGSFDGWENRIVLQGPDEDGLWATTVMLPAGRHEVTCLVDGVPTPPPGAPQYTDDGFGGRNAVIVIPE